MRDTRRVDFDILTARMSEFILIRIAHPCNFPLNSAEAPIAP